MSDHASQHRAHRPEGKGSHGGGLLTVPSKGFLILTGAWMQAFVQQHQGEGLRMGISFFKRVVLSGAFLGLAMIGVSSTLVSQAQACPTYQGRAHFGTVNLAEGFLPDPWNRSVTAGGRTDIANCGLGAWGWTATRPDYRVQYNSTGASALTFIIQSQVDTILLINAPNGSWFFDDDGGAQFGTQGLGAAIKFNNAQSGQYDIWIGSYNRGSGIPATLQITERF
jgi:hypothetical protein